MTLSKVVTKVIASYFPGRAVSCAYFRRAMVSFLTEHHLQNDTEGIAKYFSEKHAALINTSPAVMNTHYDRVQRAGVNEKTLQTVNKTVGIAPSNAMTGVIDKFEKRYHQSRDDFANSIDKIIGHKFTTKRQSVCFEVSFKDGTVQSLPGAKLLPFVSLVNAYWASVGGCYSEKTFSLDSSSMELSSGFSSGSKSGQSLERGSDADGGNSGSDSDSDSDCDSDSGSGGLSGGSDEQSNESEGEEESDEESDESDEESYKTSDEESEEEGEESFESCQILDGSDDSTSCKAASSSRSSPQSSPAVVSKSTNADDSFSIPSQNAPLTPPSTPLDLNATAEEVEAAEKAQKSVRITAEQWVYLCSLPPKPTSLKDFLDSRTQAARKTPRPAKNQNLKFARPKRFLQRRAEKEAAEYARLFGQEPVIKPVPVSVPEPASKPVPKPVPVLAPKPVLKPASRPVPMLEPEQLDGDDRESSVNTVKPSSEKKRKITTLSLAKLLEQEREEKAKRQKKK